MKKNTGSYNQNVATVLEFIYRSQKTSRIEISNHTQLTPATITHLINLLLEEKIIIETGDEARGLKGSGRSRKLLTLNESYGIFLGIEINMRGIFAVATNIKGKILTEKVVTNYSLKDINQTILTILKELLDIFSSENIIGIGIAVPGHYDKKNKTIISNNKNWRYFNLDKINKDISIPIIIENNIECMALNEYLFQAEKSPNKFLFFHIGHGLFCSFFDSTQLGIQENYYIGEIGHSIVDINGPKCECGKSGCLQTYISNTWLLKNAKYLYDHSNNTILKSLTTSSDEISLETIVHAYTLGDPFLKNQINLGINLLATSIANTLIVHDANKIYINSELLNYKNFKNTMIDQIRKQLNFIPTKTNLEVTVLPFDKFRGAIGACALVSLFQFVKHKKFYQHKII